MTLCCLLRVSPVTTLVSWPSVVRGNWNQGSFVLLYFKLFTFSDLYWGWLSVFSFTVLFVSISQVIGCEDRLRNDLYCVEWGVKLYLNSNSNSNSSRVRLLCTIRNQSLNRTGLKLYACHGKVGDLYLKDVHGETVKSLSSFCNISI